MLLKNLKSLTDLRTKKAIELQKLVVKEIDSVVQTIRETCPTGKYTILSVDRNIGEYNESCDVVVNDGVIETVCYYQELVTDEYGDHVLRPEADYQKYTHAEECPMYFDYKDIPRKYIVEAYISLLRKCASIEDRVQKDINTLSKYLQKSEGLQNES